MRFLLSLLLLLSFVGAAQTPAQTNKQLFDRTVDELNFRTFETVYDKHFTRQKYPATLRTAAARRQFTGFENNAELQRLFLNYNGVAERYKLRFGNGALSMAEFQKQLNSVLRDRNFEFFIRGLPRDEKQALIRTEERIIKQATARFNASGEAASPAAAPAETEEAPVASAPLTTNGTDAAEQAELTASTSGPVLRGEAPALASSGGPGWVGYLTLLASLGSFGLLLYTAATLLPELRRLRRRVRTLEAEQEAYYAAPDDEQPTPTEQSETTPRPSFFSRFGPQTTGELPTDSYDDESTPTR
jgi:hypothetical protein